MSRLLFGGLTTVDLAYFQDELPIRGGKGTTDRFYIDVGGPVANAAITAATLGGEVHMHSVIGSGVFADLARETLAGYSVGILEHGDGVNLPVASIWIDATGERTILSTDNRRSEVEANRALISMDGVAGVLLDGHYPQLQLAVAKAAKAAGVPIVLDCGRWRPVFAELLPVATDVIMTATFRPPELSGAVDADAILGIQDRYELAVAAVSRGPDSILLTEGVGILEIPVPQVEVLDTTGAGDVLHGAYLHYRYGEGRAAAEALQHAGAVASNSCAVHGARLMTHSE